MRKILIVLAVFLMATFFAANAIAIPHLGAKDGSTGASVLPNTHGYTWVDSPYWTLTDLTTGENGSAFFMLLLENAAYESDFGLYTVDNVTHPSSIVSHFQVFAYDEEPFTDRSVYFKSDGGGWEISSDNVAYSPFDSVFGFYYGVHTGGASDPKVAYTYYSDPFFNTVDQGDQHVAIEWNGIENVRIYLEDLRTANADWDWSDMTVLGNDLKPVPEPATMLLLGAGLLGLAGFRKRFPNK